MTTLFAPSRRNGSATSTRIAFVFTCTPARDSTRFGLSSTDLPRRSKLNERIARVRESVRHPVYSFSEGIATRDRTGRLSLGKVFPKQPCGRDSTGCNSGRPHERPAAITSNHPRASKTLWPWTASSARPQTASGDASKAAASFRMESIIAPVARGNAFSASAAPAR